MAIKMNKSNPFDWGVKEGKAFMSIPQQANAEYMELPKEVFQGNDVTSFYFNQQAGTTNLRHICSMTLPSTEPGKEENTNTEEPVVEPTDEP